MERIYIGILPFTNITGTLASNEILPSSKESYMDRIFSKINDLGTVLWVETALFIAAAALLFGMVVEFF